MSDFNNPLEYLEIGSCSPVASGQSWSSSIFRKNITRTVGRPTKWASMQGQSDYVYNKQMNQGSSGIAGSYGVSGVAKASAAVSAYFGNSSAQSGKTMKVNYQIIVRGGVESVNFEDLTPADLIAALSDASQLTIRKALDAYIRLNEALEKSSLEEPKLFSVLRQPEQHKNEHGLYLQWLKEVQNFKDNYGDGVVVKVAWGGIGIVSMEISNSSGESVWKYGGEANFSYASPGASVSVGATYDGNQSHGKANVTVECKQFSSGSSVQAQTDEWFRTVSGKSFEQLANVAVLDKAPDMTTRAAVQKPPEFEKPKQDPQLTDKIGKIKDLDGLKLYAKAAAYDKAKKGNPGLTLDKFLSDAEKEADVKPLGNLADELEKGWVELDAPIVVVVDDDWVLTDAVAADGDKVGIMEETVLVDGLNTELSSLESAEASSKEARASGTSASTPFEGYTPIGVWIANWDHLFPWLATGFLNSVADIKDVKPLLAYRVMLQDFLALSKLYYVADNCKFSPTLFKDAPQLVGELKQFADSFSQAAAKLQSKLSEERKRLDSAPGADFYTSTMQSIVNSLNNKTRKIYKVWSDIGFLRKCELGLGIMGGDSTTESAAGNMSPQVSANGKSSVQRLTGRYLDFRSSWLDTDWGWNAQDYGEENNPSRSRFFTAKRQACLFDPRRPNPDYSAFAGFYKVLPLIVPIGNQMKIYAFGPGNNVLGYLTHPTEYDRPSSPSDVNWRWDLFFSKNPGIKDSFVFVGDDGFGTLHLPMSGPNAPFRFVPWDPVEFTPNAESKTLEARGLKLYPIPFSAAEGISDWKGQSFSTNVASQTDLRSALKGVESQLKARNAWSFSDDGWPRGWDVTEPYRVANIPMQYMGLLDEKTSTAG
jgi:hypothetical protein